MYEPQFKCKRNGVPILSHEDIESDAEMFLRDFDPEALENPKEVDIEKFAEFYLGLTPEYNNLTHCGLILGRMVFNDSNRVPVYDADSKRAEYISAKRGTVMIDNTLLEDDHRFRSTMGHESGHWIYQQSYFYRDPNQLSFFDNLEQTSTACRKTDIEGGEPQGPGKRQLCTDHDWLEHQAKYFSAAILMPRQAMKLVCGDKRERDYYRNTFPGFELEMMAGNVSEIFNVSSESAKIRIKQLGYDFEYPVIQSKSIFTIGYPSSVYSL